MAKRDHERRMASMSAWTDEELRLLDKAMTKFPIGTPRRCGALQAATAGVAGLMLLGT